MKKKSIFENQRTHINPKPSRNLYNVKFTLKFQTNPAIGFTLEHDQQDLFFNVLRYRIDAEAAEKYRDFQEMKWKDVVMWPVDEISVNRDEELKKYAESLDLEEIINLGHLGTGKERENDNETDISDPKLLKLALTITKIAKTDFEKVKLIYIWITHNISYDVHSYNNKTINVNKATPKTVLKTKLAACGGFANLFAALGKSLGLEVEKVEGYCKGFGFEEGTVLDKSNHAWNVYISGNRIALIDCTWGAGGTAYCEEKEDGKSPSLLKTEKTYNNYWFNTNPYSFLFNHLPEDDIFQCVDRRLNLSEFCSIPDKDEDYMLENIDKTPRELLFEFVDSLIWE